ncbi:hypothetical protein [Legionella sp. 31fI33]|uniref:hypothetical protein n=1 Tax=Legionella sp. 31fI33 TaxID=2886376 RepID=UPI001E3F03BC|nr:hypothetical protein [Legionella sp. 31fI33]MCC5016335.1 hypothetical protein [Legionella sp. 31fI33]
MPVTRYIFIPELTTFYDDRDYPQKIATAIKKAIAQKYFKAHSTRQEASDPKDSLFRTRFPMGGILELQGNEESELSPDYISRRCTDILALSSDEQRTKQLSAFIKKVHVKGFTLPFAELDLKEREAAQRQSFDFNPVEDSALQLTQPPLLYLKKIRPELLFLLFTDHQFFLNFENWRHYNAREPKGRGCVYDLFHATTTLCERLMTPSKATLTMEEIQTLHKQLSESVFANLKEDKRGIFRESYNSFPLHYDAVTIAGIKELLQRIKSDKQAEGFRIGYFKKSLIVSSFCNNMSILIRQEEPWKKFPLDEEEVLTSERLKELEEFERSELERLEALAINETAKSKNIPLEDVKAIIKRFLQDFTPHKRVVKSHYWPNLSYYYSDLSTNYRHSSPKAEYQYDLGVARSHALASAGSVTPPAVNIQDLTEQELEDLAKKIYKEIQGGANIHLFTPEPTLALKWAQEALQKYNRTIPNTQNAGEAIQIVDDLVHELEILHLFYDVNCRTNYLLMNFLFLRRSIKWATEFNPNRLDAHSSKERVLQHKQAILRTDYLIANQEQLAQYNERLDLIYFANLRHLQTVQYTPTELSAIQVDAQYAEIAQPLIDKLAEFETLFQATLNTLLKKYDLPQTAVTPQFFPVPPEYMPFVKALKQLQSDYNINDFFTRVTDLELVVEIREDLKRLQTLTGYNAQSLLAEIPTVEYS